MDAPSQFLPIDKVKVNIRHEGNNYKNVFNIRNMRVDDTNNVHSSKSPLVSQNAVSVSTNVNSKYTNDDSMGCLHAMSIKYNSAGIANNSFNSDALNTTAKTSPCRIEQVIPTPYTVHKALTTDNTGTMLNIICWNIRGIGDKIKYSDIQTILFNKDIVVITETHTEHDSEKLYNCIPGYIYKDFPRKYKHQRAPCASGGIGVYIRENLINGIYFEQLNECIVWIRLKSKYFKLSRDIIIGGVYFSPSDSSYIHNTTVRTDYFNILAEEVAVRSNSDLYICGDMNARTGNMIDNTNVIPGHDGNLLHLLCPANAINRSNNLITTRKNRDENVNEYGRQLINFCKSTNIQIMNGRLGDINNTGDFTCYKSNGGASAVDYLLCSAQCAHNITNLEVLDKHPESDHRPLAFSINLLEIPTVHKSSDTSTRLVMYKWDTNKLETYRENFQKENIIRLQEELITGVYHMNCNEIGDKFHEILTTAVSSTFKKKKTSQTLFPRNEWFNIECKESKKVLHDFSKKHDITLPEHAETYSNLEKEYRRIVQKCRRQYYDNVRLKLEQCSSKNPKTYWDIWKSQRPRMVNNSTLTIEDFTSYFVNQVTPPEVAYFDKEHMENISLQVAGYDFTQCDYNTAYEICNGVITEKEIKFHVNKLKNNKASGVDGIVAEFFKYAPLNLIPILYTVYNGIFDKGKWPTQWSIGLISPVHKKNSINIPDNYRKITVMPVIGKILESILNTRLTYKNIVLEIDDPCQFGFKKGCSTVDNIFIMYSLILKQKAKRKPLWVCFVDFTKAFDYVNRLALYEKLVRQGVSGKMLQIITDMYRKAHCKVKWKGMIGNDIASEFGVLQGGIMSPKLFTEYLADLKEYLDTTYGIQMSNDIVTYILYADDMVLCSDSASGLQNQIDGLYKFCSKWHLIVSLAKTNIMVFGKNNTPSSFKFGNDDIKLTSEYNYLGVIFSNKRSLFKLNSTSLSDKANNAVFALNSVIKNSVGHLQPSLAMKMFDTQVSPILEYGSEVWFKNKDVSYLEKHHIGYMKNVLKVKMSTSTLPLYAELGRFPIALKMKMRIINYWNKILSSECSSIVKHCYMTLLDLHNSGQENWCSVVKSILEAADSVHCWLEQKIDRHDITTIKESIYNNFMISCMTDIQNADKNPKLRTYKLFKKEFRLEPYLSECNNINHTQSLTRFRISAHNLAIETGRYTKPKTPAENRLCIYCNQNSVETEQHFLLKCPLYLDNRKILFDIIKVAIPNIEENDDESKFFEIMTCNDPLVYKALGRFIHDGIIRRGTIEIH